MAYGPVILFGSGETARHGRQAQESVLRSLLVPARVAILETPAGFQPNVDHVTEKLRDFVEHSLQNYRPEVTIVPARGIGQPGADPNDSAVAANLDGATYIFAGPGSPTYAARTLAGTATLDRIRSRWADGAGLALASAAAIAFGTHVLPVYEIYKAGDDLGWRTGLDLFAPLGLDLTVIPHWNNREGGEHLDTSRCYMGVERFGRLRAMLPPSTVVLGIDEHTSCIIESEAGMVRVCGQSTITVISGDDCCEIPAGDDLPLAALRARTGILARR